MTPDQITRASELRRMIVSAESRIDRLLAELAELTGSSKPTIPEVRERFEAYFQKHPTWGSLHVVLDDGNVEDHFVLHARELADVAGDTEGFELADILLAMSKTQRLKLGRSIR